MFFILKLVIRKTPDYKIWKIGNILKILYSRICFLKKNIHVKLKIPQSIFEFGNNF